MEEKYVSNDDSNSRVWMSILNCSNSSLINLSSNTQIKINNLNISFIFFLMRVKLQNNYKILELANSMLPFDVTLTHKNIDYRFFIIPEIPYVNIYNIESITPRYIIGLKVNNTIYRFITEFTPKFLYNIPEFKHIKNMFDEIISLDYESNANFEDYWCSYQDTLFSWKNNLYNKYSFKILNYIRDKNNVSNYVEWSGGSLRNYLQGKLETVKITNVKLSVNETLLDTNYLKQYEEKDEYWLNIINRVLNTNRNIIIDAEGN